ncbi:xanthine phosphoribosyltransferase [Gracilibacillus halophilus YIM-C55.5]|uniref:Xanthine phosphoribosyltransferase n=1 Tax=Gracilibacillus halophilus YIM-C55.5 TaxID=1308866 RepID=N4W6D8_9BACI|nr:xanthine phosphoribosyltransferase [Gracilibacillus halophilus YIM-C55.5]
MRIPSFYSKTLPYSLRTTLTLKDGLITSTVYSYTKQETNDISIFDQFLQKDDH